MLTFLASVASLMLAASLPCKLEVSDCVGFKRLSMDDCRLISGRGLWASSSSGSPKGEPSIGLTGFDWTSRKGSLSDRFEVGVMGRVLLVARDVLLATAAAPAAPAAAPAGR